MVAYGVSELLDARLKHVSLTPTRTRIDLEEVANGGKVSELNGFDASSADRHETVLSEIVRVAHVCGHSPRSGRSDLTGSNLDMGRFEHHRRCGFAADQLDLGLEVTRSKCKRAGRRSRETASQRSRHGTA